MKFTEIIKKILPDQESKESSKFRKENFHIVGMAYFENNLKKLECANPEWRLQSAGIKKNGLTGKKIYHYTYINKPVKIVQENKKASEWGSNSLYVAGEKIGVTYEDDSEHIRHILNDCDVKYISVFIAGGPYKLLTESGELIQVNENFTITLSIGYIG